MVCKQAIHGMVNGMNPNIVYKVEGRPEPTPTYHHHHHPHKPMKMLKEKNKKSSSFIEAVQGQL